jgi:thiol:disulfide interchange protein
MNETLSTRQLRLVALLALVVVVAGGYWVVVRHKSSSPSTAGSTPVATTPAKSTPATTTPSPSKTHTHTATPAKFNTHGLPVPVALALRKHSVVVVSLYSPSSEVDKLASAEAQAGAAAMGAGFVNLDVYHQRPGTAVLRKLGVVDTPAVLVVKRRGGVYSEFKGFVDRNVVEQAVADARG